MADRLPVLVVIGGPTASGKTAVAARIAERLATEVISADSRQFYRDLRIGTARPTGEELRGVPHHFLGHLPLEETWSAGEFARQAEPVLQAILAAHGIALVVGGSGLYIDALCHGLDPLPVSDPALRSELQDRLERHGLEALTEALRTLDPDAWSTVDRRNPQRVIRALEIRLLSGRPVGTQRSGPRVRTDVRILRIALELPRPELYARIDQRVDRMIAEGLEEEARTLLPHRRLNALNTVGYKELFSHFDGELDRATAIALIKQHTRNYAKRQLTWLRRDPTWKAFHPEDIEGMLSAIERTG